MSSIEIIGGIKAENVAIKSEKGSNEGEYNVVEIRAEDIQDGIKREPEENEEERDGKSNIFELRIEDIDEDTQEDIKTEVDQQVGKKGTDETKPYQTGDLQEKLILNYVDNDVPGKKIQYTHPENKINNNVNDENGNKVQAKPRNRKKAKNLSNEKIIDLSSEKVAKSEYARLKEDGKYRCNYCQTFVTSRKKIYKHIRQFHRDPDVFNNRKAQLEQLVDKCKTVYCAWYEYKFEGEDMYRCSHCKELIRGKKCNIETHIIDNHRTHKDKIYNQCPYCPFRTLFDLKGHIISTHTDEKDIQYFSCDKCDFKTKFKNGVRRHIQTTHMFRQLKCPQCLKTFKHRDTLGKHTKLIHSSDSTVLKKVKCFHCPYECKSRDGLRHHIETRHTKVEDLETLRCTQCQYKTKHKNRLQAHISVNHRRVLQCHICSYQCTIKATMDLHLIGHKTEKTEKDMRYCCDKCDYRTHRTYSLQVHKLNHLKPEEIQYFYCYHCEFKAKRKDNLKTHVLRHFKHDEVLLQCYRCDFKTKKRLILVRHLDGHSRKLTKVKKDVSNVTTVKLDALVDYEDELLKEAAREKKEQAEDSTVTEKQLEEIKTKSESDNVLPIRRSQRRKRKSKT